MASSSCFLTCLTHAQPTRRGADDVAEHGTGLDRGQLLGVADEDQARVGTVSASSSRAISDNETMEVSSTTTTSWGSRFDLL